MHKHLNAAYANNWVSGHINWGQWMQTDEAKKLRDDPTALAKATDWLVRSKAF